MNLREYREITDDELNARVALFCGYSKFNTKDLAAGLKAIGQSVPDIKHEYESYWVNQAGQIKSLPNYCKDLNEMYVAERWLWREGMAWRDYAVTLRSITDGNFEVTDIDVRPVFATARERAEAFVFTMEGNKKKGR